MAMRRSEVESFVDLGVEFGKRGGERINRRSLRRWREESRRLS